MKNKPTPIKHEIYVFEFANGKLKQISYAFDDLNEATDFINTMKAGARYKNSILIAMGVLKIK